METTQADQNQKQTNTADLEKLFKLKIGAKVMSQVNSNIHFRLINGQTGNNSQIEFAQSSVQKVYIKFVDEQAGVKAVGSSYLGRQNSCLPIERCES